MSSYLCPRRSSWTSDREFEIMQESLLHVHNLSATRAYVYAVAKACDIGRASRKDAAGAILFAAERATGMALEASNASRKRLHERISDGEIAA